MRIAVMIFGFVTALPTGCQESSVDAPDHSIAFVPRPSLSSDSVVGWESLDQNEQNRNPPKFSPHELTGEWWQTVQKLNGALIRFRIGRDGRVIEMTAPDNSSMAGFELFQKEFLGKRFVVGKIKGVPTEFCVRYRIEVK